MGCWKVVETLGDGGLVRGGKSLGMGFEGIFCPQLLLPSLLPEHHKMSSFVPLYAPTMILCLTTVPQKQHDHRLKLLSHKPKEIFPPLSRFSQAFCHSNKQCPTHQVWRAWNGPRCPLTRSVLTSRASSSTQRTFPQLSTPTPGS